jgi:hypothetical protein
MASKNDSQENIRFGQPNEKKIILTLCELISFLIANILKTEKEWKEWGMPYLQLIFVSQFQEEEGNQLLEDFQKQFFPLIGHGITLWIEESISRNPDSPHPSEDDYVIITLLEDRLKKVLANYLAITDNEQEIQNHLKIFLQRFYQHIEKIEHYYDSRERTIARKVCSILNVSAQQFSELEKEYSHFNPSTAENNSIGPNDIADSENNSLFLTLFNRHSQEIPKDSLLVSYRMWRVAFVAAGGGAMVGMAGVMAAPAIISTVIPVLSSACTFAQISVAMETFTSSIGVLSYTLLPGVFSTYGATVAGSVMMKRTAAIKDFELLPLHIHEDRESAAAQTKTENNKDYYLSKDTTGLPVFILVNGHVDRKVDSRVMWGGNGSEFTVQEKKISTIKDVSENIETKSEGNEKILLETNKQDHIELNPIKETIHLLQQDLIEESKIIADTILQSICAITPQTSSKEEKIKNIKSESFEEISSDQSPSLPEESNIKEQEETPNDAALHEWEELEFSYSQGWFKEFIPYGEEYVLSWENDLLSHLNETFYKMIKNKISSTIMHHIKDFIYQQVPTPLMAMKKSFALPNLVLAKIKQLDDIWVIAMDRALQGGKLLAKILLKQFQAEKSNSTLKKDSFSHRPVSLIGYGMGARLIYHCLESLVQECPDGDLEKVKGMIENVVLIGAPLPVDLTKFAAFRSIVSGRFINCYSRYDWILALLYRSKSYEFHIAGLSPIHLPNSHFSSKKIGVPSGKELMIKNISLDNQLTIELGESDLFQEKEKEILMKFHEVIEEGLAIENYDVTDLVHVQTDYPKVLPSIIQRIELQK